MKTLGTALMAVLLVVVAACGDDDSEGTIEPEPTATRAETPEPTATPESEPTATPEPTGSGDGVASGPLVLTGAQLEDVVLLVDAVAELMGAETVEVTNGSFFGQLIGAVPSGTTVEAHDYWSLDSGGRSIGEGPVDYVSVIMVLVAEQPDVVPLFDQITEAEPEYTRWVPITIRGAEVAEQAEGIPYEGQPDDEPAFEAILARRDRLIVAAIVSGSDTNAMVETATGLAELVLERAGEVSDAGDVTGGGNGSGDPLADAFAEQLVTKGELALPDENRVDCFAGRVVSALSEDRLGALGFTGDEIPSIYDVDWTNEEIELLVDSLQTCVSGDPDSITVIVAGPDLARYQPDLADCYAAELAAAAGEDFYIDLFRVSLTTRSAEDEQDTRQVLEQALAVCQPDAPTPLPGLEDEDAQGFVEDGWSISISLDDEGGTIHNVHMIKTFSPLEEADIEDLGGRLIWPETELELCGVEIQSVGDGFVQIGNFFPAREDCEPAMVRAFADFGLPETACLFVRVDGVDDEHCAPLPVD